MHYSLMVCYIEVLFKAGLTVYAIFIELCMKGDPFVHLKGK